MNFQFHLDEVHQLGDYDSTFGQIYWCIDYNEEHPLKFNSQNRDIKAGDDLEAEEKAMKKSTKGNTYWQLKKVKIVGAATVDSTVITESKPHPTHTISDSAILDTLEWLKEGQDTILAMITDLNAKIDSIAPSRAPSKASSVAKKLNREVDEEIDMDDDSSEPNPDQENRFPEDY